MTRVLLLGLFSLSIWAVGVGPVSAFPDSSCPNNFVGTGLGGFPDPSIYFHIDRNGNGVVCVKQVETGDLLVVDDSNPTTSGACVSAGFEPFTVSDQTYAPVDRNNDGQLCKKTLPSGDLLVIDNTPSGAIFLPP